MDTNFTISISGNKETLKKVKKALSLKYNKEIRLQKKASNWELNITTNYENNDLAEKLVKEYPTVNIEITVYSRSIDHSSHYEYKLNKKREFYESKYQIGYMDGEFHEETRTEDEKVSIRDIPADTEHEEQDETFEEKQNETSKEKNKSPKQEAPTTTKNTFTQFSAFDDEDEYQDA